MIAYYLQIAIKNLLRQKTISVLMVLTLGLGIGASITNLAVFRVLARDPIPQKSARLFYPQLDSSDMRGYVPGEEPNNQLTRFDAQTLLKEARGLRQAMMSGGSMVLESPDGKMEPLRFQGRFTTADFFTMFETPFEAGAGWSQAHDDQRARVAVISHAARKMVFGRGQAIGETIRIDRQDFEVIGVLKPDWNAKTSFYDVTNLRFNDEEHVYLPFSTAMELKLSPAGSLNCWGNRDDVGEEGQRGVHASCAWLQYWVELEDAPARDAYLKYLERYSDAQRESGRFERPTNVRLNDVMEWLEKNEVVPSDIRLRLWVSLGFLLVCIVNTAGLLLTKFMRRSGSLGIRRALGASKSQIFSQLLIEAGLLGACGCGFGLLLAQLGLYLVRQQSESYASYVHLDPTMLACAFALSFVATLLAGSFPAWRACRLRPAKQLKSQ